MKQVNAKKDFRVWESVLKEEPVTLTEMKQHKALRRKLQGRGQSPSGALVDIFTRLYTEHGVECPMKYVFPDVKVAENFRGACLYHVHMHLPEKKEMITITRCETTVYIMRIA